MKQPAPKAPPAKKRLAAQATKASARVAQPRGRPAPAAAPPKAAPARTGQAVKVTAAKGRPMLVWVGKRPLTHVTAFPAQHVEQFSAVNAVTCVSGRLP